MSRVDGSARCKRVMFLTGLAAASVARAAIAAESSYDLVTKTGTIFGTLSQPITATKAPVVLIVAGSGPTDRDGNSPGVHAGTYRLLADALAAEGIASLRYDKRGIARSAAAMPDEASLRFDDYVSDAAEWLAKLRGDGRFGKIGLAGHSEGSLIGMIAAQRMPCDYFASLSGAGFPAAEELRRQLGPQLASQPQLAAENDRILAALTAGQTVADVPQALMVLYRPSVQPYIISWFRYDPRVEIAKLAMKCAIVQGTNDVQIPVADAQALAAAQPRATLVLVDGMTHVLKDATETTAADQAQTVYQDPTVPINRTVVRTIVEAMS